MEKEYIDITHARTMRKRILHNTSCNGSKHKYTGHNIDSESALEIKAHSYHTRFKISMTNSTSRQAAIEIKSQLRLCGHLVCDTHLSSFISSECLQIPWQIVEHQHLLALRHISFLEKPFHQLR